MAIVEEDVSVSPALYMYGIWSGSISESGGIVLSNFLGTGFLVTDSGYLATCRHVTDQLDDGSQLFAISNEENSYAIKEVVRHDDMDFAICIVDMPLPSPYLKVLDSDGLAGADVLGYGKVYEKSVERNHVKQLLFSGNIVRTEPIPELPNTRSVCELSFPVISGMSGGPLLVHGEKLPTVCGMLYGNKETSILSHKLEEREEDGTRYYERVDRIFELGCAHSSTDLIAFMSDFGLTFNAS